MQRPRKVRIPTYRLHRPSGQAVVILRGKDHYLGPYGSERSRGEYDRLVAEYVPTSGPDIAHAKVRPTSRLPNCARSMSSTRVHATSSMNDQPRRFINPQMNEAWLGDVNLGNLRRATEHWEFETLWFLTHMERALETRERFDRSVSSLPRSRLRRYVRIARFLAYHVGEFLAGADAIGSS